MLSVIIWVYTRLLILYLGLGLPPRTTELDLVTMDLVTTALDVYKNLSSAELWLCWQHPYLFCMHLFLFLTPRVWRKSMVTSP